MARRTFFCLSIRRLLDLDRVVVATRARANPRTRCTAEIVTQQSRGDDVATRAGARGGARARGPGRDTTDGIRIDVSRSVRATTRDRRRRETTTGDDDGRAEGDARRADDKIEDGRRTSAERGDGEGGLSVIVYRGGSLCRVASGCFFLSSPSRVCDGHPGVRFGALGRRAGADD